MTVTFGARLEEVRDTRARRRRLPKLPHEAARVIAACKRSHQKCSGAASYRVPREPLPSAGLVLGMSGSSCTRCKVGEAHKAGKLPQVTVVAPPVRPRLCLRCGNPVDHRRRRLCGPCTRQPTSYEGLAVAMEHSR